MGCTSHTLFHRRIYDLNKFIVHAGTIYLNETGDAYQAESITWHRASDDFERNFDIGLIRLNRDIAFSNVIKPIALAQEDFAKENLTCTISGWGRLSVSNPSNPSNPR